MAHRLQETDLPPCKRTEAGPATGLTDHRSLASRFAARMDRLLGGEAVSRIGIAASGGGDSTALVHVAQGWAGSKGIGLACVTVDHGLRAASKDEAQAVARLCARLGVPHTIIRWEGWSGQGNLQDAAREARLRLIDEWRGDIAHMLFGHTRDDQAETVLMRIARGTGVDGLCGIPMRRRVTLQEAGITSAQGGYVILRPLLDEARATLRAWLRVRRLTWVEDPSNHSPDFARVRARKALAHLETADVGALQWCNFSRTMTRVQEALHARATQVAQEYVAICPVTADPLIKRDMFPLVEEETALRILAEALRVVSSRHHRPRLASLIRLAARIAGGQTGTLQGCLLHPDGAHVRVSREWRVVGSLVAHPGWTDCWDARWRFQATATGQESQEFRVRALGEDGLRMLGLLMVPFRKLPQASLITQPAAFVADRLISCPAAGVNGPVRFVHTPPAGGFGAAWMKPVRD